MRSRPLGSLTTVIVFAPLTALITRMLVLNPAPHLIAEAMLSNAGGVATLVGTPEPSFAAIIGLLIALTLVWPDPEHPLERA